MRRIIFVSAVVMSLFAVISCDKYDDGRPAKAVRAEFNRMYPDAWDVEWEREGACWEVTFETGSRPNGTEHAAWYDMDGNWVQTVTEIMLSAVPRKIKDALSASEYGTGRFEDDDAELYETPYKYYYRFDLIYDGADIEVDVYEDGEVLLVKYGF